MNLINVSKWFDELQYIEPDNIVSISIYSNDDPTYHFSVNVFGNYYLSESYPTKQDCEFAMEEFIKCLNNGKELKCK